MYYFLEFYKEKHYMSAVILSSVMMQWFFVMVYIFVKYHPIITINQYFVYSHNSIDTEFCLGLKWIVYKIVKYLCCKWLLIILLDAYWISWYLILEVFISNHFSHFSKVYKYILLCTLNFMSYYLIIFEKIRYGLTASFKHY